MDLLTNIRCYVVYYVNITDIFYFISGKSLLSRFQDDKKSQNSGCSFETIDSYSEKSKKNFKNFM